MFAYSSIIKFLLCNISSCFILFSSIELRIIIITFLVRLSVLKQMTIELTVLQFAQAFQYFNTKLWPPS